MKQEEIQQAVMQMRYLEQQIGYVQQQMTAFNNVLVELEATVVALNAMKEMKEDTNAMSPIGSGVYATSVLKKSDNVLFEVGAGMSVEKPIDEVLSLISERKKNTEGQITKMTNTASELENQYVKLAESVRGN